MKAGELLQECNQLALLLSLNCTFALARQKIFPKDQAEFCAIELRRVAQLVDAAGGREALPPRLAKDLNDLALLLLMQE